MNDPVIIGDATLYRGDALEILPRLSAGSADAVVTDGPYGLKFMGKDWDHGIPGVRFWTEILRVAKPGAHLLAFGGTRTFHRLACAIEDAGWEIRDCVMWVYGSGFPKSLDVSKAIDRAMFTTKTLNPDFQAVRTWLRSKVKDKGLTYREIDAALGNENSHKASHYLDNSQPQLPTVEDWGIIKGLLQLDDASDLDRPPRLLVETFEREIVGYRTVHRGVAFSSDGPTELPITKPICGVSARWQGWGTALKPAWEPIIVARKPLDGTVAANVQKHGTGGMNIDGCRIAVDPEADARDLGRVLNRGVRSVDDGWGMNDNKADNPVCVKPEGRWPANVVHDGSEEVVGLFPQTGVSAGGRCRKPGSSPFGHERVTGDAGFGDSGSAARFFYCAKASKKDRDEGLDGQALAGGPETLNPSVRTNRGGPRQLARRNAHPTVKPTALMRWLCRLVTPPGGIVLDPFMGSGSTGKACAREEFRFIGIELDADYFDIACRRIEHAMTGGPLLKGKA